MILGLLTLCLGCDILGTHDCTANLVPALVVDILDAATGVYVADSALTTALDGDYRTSLDGCGFDGGMMISRCGAYERPGRYTVVVAHPRFEVWIRDVEVKDDDCHVRTQSLVAELEALQPTSPARAGGPTG